jgi:uncharacterized protein (UPF0371 family)
MIIKHFRGMLNGYAVSNLLKLARYHHTQSRRIMHIMTELPLSVDDSRVLLRGWQEHEALCQMALGAAYSLRNGG